MKRKLRTIIFAALLAGVADAACSYLWLRSVEREISIARNISAGAAIVPFSDFGALSGVNAETHRRLAAAVALYRDKRIQFVVCVGGTRLGRRICGSERMKQILVSEGIPEDAIFVDLRSNDTISNIAEAIRILKQRDLQSAVVVSSPCQLNRIRRILAGTVFSGRIELARYDFSSASPRISVSEIWMQIHYEWLATAIHAVLPSSAYRSLVNMLRR